MLDVMRLYREFPVGPQWLKRCLEHIAAEAIKSARPEVARSEPVAWLYTCFKPGHQEVFASVSEDDSTHWPLDQWTKVTKVPLFAESPLARKPDADPA